ncbi:MAG TPA: threonine synthase [Alphaproteobacteria bacterium]|nr:threonine synthase [Alphaproteobacteria bacterium]
MRYISTRGGSPVDFEQAVREGLAPDGGLFVPESFKPFSAADLRAMQPLTYIELAVRVMKDFVAPALSPGELAALAQDSYANFGVEEVTPLRKLKDNLHVLELFHGPTLAFKDVALQFLSRVFGHIAHKHGGALTVLGATSGDTGSAAIAGCSGIAGVRVFILYPEGGPSELQRRQMTTVEAENVHVLAVKGSFDDCQALVKRAFQDEDLKKRLQLTAVNSINWARIIAQTVYYFYAGLKAGALEKPVTFAVPSGNFGNIYAGYVAKRLGLPIKKLLAATNRNDTLARFIQTGELQPGSVAQSLSPSMDIQNPSNLERYVFELLGRDANALKTALQSVKEGRGFKLSPAQMQAMQQEFSGEGVSDEQTRQTISDVLKNYGVLVDPHTAVGLHAALRQPSADTVISLACAHPAKFPETVQKATGQSVNLPPALAALRNKRERVTVIPSSDGALREFILGHT